MRYQVVGKNLMRNTLVLQSEDGNVITHALAGDRSVRSFDIGQTIKLIRNPSNYILQEVA